MILPYFCVLFLIASCGGKETSSVAEEQEKTGEIKEMPPVPVEVKIVKENPFSHEIISNGKLEGSRVAEIRFNGNGRIERIAVHNGQKVTRGQLLAKMDDYEQKNALLQAQIAWEDAKISFADYLIGLGHDIQDTLSVPKDILRSSKIRSGFSRAQRELQMAQFKLEQTALRAPVSGIVASMDNKENTYPDSQDAFCKIIDNSSFQVRFPIVESEANLVSIGDSVTIIPYYDQQQSIAGILAGINPIVDENGLIEVTAQIKSPDRKLLEGMNVKIQLKQDAGLRLSVPKEAITLRTEREVVFVYKNGMAMWNYVETGLENSSRIIIESGIKPGDSVIVKGGLHLAHEAPVTLTKVSQDD